MLAFSWAFPAVLITFLAAKIIQPLIRLSIHASCRIFKCLGTLDFTSSAPNAIAITQSNRRLIIMLICQVTMCAGTGELSSPGTSPAPNATAITQTNRRLIILSFCQNQNRRNATQTAIGLRWYSKVSYTFSQLTLLLFTLIFTLWGEVRHQIRHQLPNSTIFIRPLIQKLARTLKCSL